VLPFDALSDEDPGRKARVCQSGQSADSGLFWIAEIDSDDVEVGNGRASMDVDEIRIEDYHDFVNSTVDGPSLDAVASFRAEWSASHDRHHFRNPANTFDEQVVINPARVWWRFISPIR
jgi:hypothetical protein